MSQSSFKQALSALKHPRFCLFVDVHTSRLSRRAGSVVSPRRFTACWEKEIKTYLAPTPFFLDSFVYCIFWVHHSKFSSVKILLFSYSNNLTGLGIFFFLVVLIYPCILFPCCKSLTVSYMLVKNKQGITVTKLFLKLKYIFMRLWLFIAESPFYTQYIKCYLSRFLVSYICVFEKNHNQK